MRQSGLAGYHRVSTSIWSDPEFVTLSPAAQLTYFYARCWTGRSVFGYEAANRMGLTLTNVEFEEASRELGDSAYGRVFERSKRRDIPLPVRRLVMERDGTCRHCGSDNHLCLDHIVPLSLGGEDTVENLQVLCRSCNSRKGARLENPVYQA